MKPCYESGYIYGEDINYCFSGDEKRLLQTLRTGWWYAEVEEANENGDTFYEFGQINILNIDAKIFESHLLHVYPSDDWHEEITDNGPIQFDKLMNDGLLHVILPWGQATFHDPLEDILVIRSK